MFDSFVVNRVTKTEVQDIRVNSVSGTLVRSHEKSIITKVIPNTELENGLFDVESPHYRTSHKAYYNTDWQGNPCETGSHFRSKDIIKTFDVEVLQVMLCGDFMLVEFILIGERK